MVATIKVMIMMMMMIEMITSMMAIMVKNVGGNDNVNNVHLS